MKAKNLPDGSHRTRLAWQGATMKREAQDSTSYKSLITATKNIQFSSVTPSPLFSIVDLGRSKFNLLSVTRQKKDMPI
jgi:hypothetical protein